MRILVAGASGDIGLAVCKKLSKQNTLYAIVNNGNDNLTQIVDRNNIYHLDFNDSEQVSKFNIDFSVDALIHLSGISHFGLVQYMSHDEWNKILNINLSSAFFITKLALPNMINQKFGKIIFGSSIWGRLGASYEVAYSASKGGIDTYARALAKEVAPSNIAVNSIDFGFIDTKMNAHLSLEEKIRIYDDIPFGRAATVEECADFISNILNMPNYFTGQVIGFDGAW